MLRQEGGPTISEGVQIFLKYEVRGVQIFRNIWTGGIQSGGGSKFFMTEHFHTWVADRNVHVGLCREAWS